MALNRVTPSGWLEETGSLSRVTPFGWVQETTSAAAGGFKGAWATRQNSFIGDGMYPRNAASPERIAIGAVIQISDGAVQTSGCTVRILESGGTEGDGGGTTAYSTDGVVLYTPTQAETDQASFVLIAKKSGCIPAAVTIVTSASATAGKVVLSGETHTSAVIPTVTTTTTATNVTTVNGLAAGVITAASIATDAIDADALATDAVTKIQSGLATPTNITAGTITTVTNLTNAPTNGDLTATMKSSVTTAATAATPTAAAVTGNVGGNVAGSVASVTAGVTLANGAHGGAAASLNLGAGATISNASGHAVTLTSSGSNGHGLLVQGHGTGSGLAASGGSTGHGIYAVGDDSGMGILAVGGDAAVALTAGLFVKSNAATNPVGLYVEDGAIITDDAGTALLVSSTGGDGDGVTITGNGSGGDLVADITGNLSGSVGSVTAEVAANITSVNDIEIDGAGTALDPWGPA